MFLHILYFQWELDKYVIAGKNHFKPSIPAVLNNVTLRKVIWCWGSEAVSFLRFYVPLQEIYSEINHRNNPGFTSHTLPEYDEKRLREVI